MAQAGPDKEGVHNLLDKDSFDKALAQSGLMVVDAFATWCGPCKAIAPKMVEYSKEYKNVRFYKFDTDELPELASELDVRAMPTFIYFKDGERVQTVLGANPPAIKAAIDTHSVGESKAPSQAASTAENA